MFITDIILLVRNGKIYEKGHGYLRKQDRQVISLQTSSSSPLPAFLESLATGTRQGSQIEQVMMMMMMMMMIKVDDDDDDDD